MHPVSQRFLDTLRKSHTPVAYCDLWRKKEIIAQNLPILGGTISDDSQAVIRRQGTFDLVATQDMLDLLPPTIPDRGGLWPVGNELHVKAGIRWGPEDEELVPVGVFRIAKVTMGESEGSLVLQVSGYDRARTVSRAKFTRPYIAGWPTWVSGTVVWQSYAKVIKDLILSRIPWLDPVADFRLMTPAHTAPVLGFTTDDDPMEKAHDMAASFGAEVYFDGEGCCVLRPTPDPVYDRPCFDYTEGVDAVLKEVKRDLDDEQAYNGVIAVAETSYVWTPYRYEAWDTNPYSPTYYDPVRPKDSVYGAVPFLFSSQYITTVAQAKDAAVGKLNQMMGILENIDFVGIHNPAHWAGDVISIGRERMSVQGHYILDTVKIGIGDQIGLSGTTRSRRVVG